MSILGNQQELDLTLFVDNKLIFKNPQSGRIKKITVGYSYLGFFFDWITLLCKGLIGYGLIVLGLNIATLIAATILSNNDRMTESVIFLLGWLGIKLCVGYFTNECQAKDLLQRGWILQNADAAKDALKAKDWWLLEDYLKKLQCDCQLDKKSSPLNESVILDDSVLYKNAVRRSHTE